MQPAATELSQPTCDSVNNMESLSVLLDLQYSRMSQVHIVDTYSVSQELKINLHRCWVFSCRNPSFHLERRNFERTSVRLSYSHREFDINEMSYFTI